MGTLTYLNHLIRVVWFPHGNVRGLPTPLAIGHRVILRSFIGYLPCSRIRKFVSVCFWRIAFDVVLCKSVLSYEKL